jgi:hypothetical protein
MQYSEQEAKESSNKKADKKTKNKLFALASAAGGVGINLGVAMGANPVFLQTSKKHYADISTPEGLKQKEAIIKAHKEATGLPDPYIVSEIPGSNRAGQESGAYLMRHLLKVPKLGEEIRAALPDIPENQGVTAVGPNASSFVLAHELGHRAQDYHKIAGPSQLVSGILPLASGLATAAVSAKAETNRGALAKGLLTSYALNLPRIISEVTATRLGNQYLKSAGIDTNSAVSLTQPLGYLLQPAAEGLLAVSQGRAIRAVRNKLQNRKKQKEKVATASQSLPVY